MAGGRQFQHFDLTGAQLGNRSAAIGFRGAAMDQPIADRRVAVHATGTDRANALHQFGGAGALRDIAGDADIEQPAQIAAIGILRGQRQHPASGAVGHEGARRFQAIAVRRRQIEHHDIGAAIDGCARRGLIGRTGSIKTAHRIDAVEHHWAIFCHERAERRQRLRVL